MHPLLKRQIKKKLVGIDVENGPWAEFIASIDAAYGEADKEREFVERTLDVVSAELTEANDKIRREAESKVRDLTRYYEQTIELQQGMIVCYRKQDGQFVHTLCRGGLAARLGWATDRVEGKSLQDFLSAKQAAELQTVYERAWDGETIKWEGTAAEGEIWFLAQLHPRRQDGRVTEVIMSAIETTEMKESEAALRAEKEKAESADRAKSEFLAVMSHEIRTPMNSVIGFASMLHETDLSTVQARYVEMIESAGDGLLDIINDVLDISKIEAGRMELSMEAIDPMSIAADVVELMRGRADEKSIKLRLEIADSVPSSVRSDRARLRQVLVNLVGNAVKFTAEGSVTLQLEYHEPDRLIGRVVDTGIGIPPEGVERLFKPFSQVDSSTTRNFGGTGLGLAICLRLCEALGGGITVRSEAGQGSTFEFHMCAPQMASSVSASPIAGSADVPDLGEEDARILVVDDHIANRRVIGLLLQTHGYQNIEYAETGEKALEIAAREKFDIVFMDIEMPGIDGIETTRRLRALAASSVDCPWIVGLSANVLKETQTTAREAGMNAFLAKPVRRDALPDALRKRRRA